MQMCESRKITKVTRCQRRASKHAADGTQNQLVTGRNRLELYSAKYLDYPSDGVKSAMDGTSVELPIDSVIAACEATVAELRREAIARDDTWFGAHEYLGLVETRRTKGEEQYVREYFRTFTREPLIRPLIQFCKAAKASGTRTVRISMSDFSLFADDYAP